MNISFDDTKTAFAYKSDKELKDARFLFSSMTKPLLVKLGLKLTPFLLKFNFGLKGLIRRYLFDQFVGGETLEKTSKVALNLAKYNIEVILDYGVEGMEGEQTFDDATETFIKVIKYAHTQPKIPFMSVKMTGIARFSLLEKLNDAANFEDVVQGKLDLTFLTTEEKEEWGRVVKRLERICEASLDRHVAVLIDAEESWIQHPVDALITQMMMQYNKDEIIIYNTAQLYRHDRLRFIRENNAFAKQNNFRLGMKLVRGAYMEKERERAEKMGYESPINPTKEATDEEYNAAVAYCLDPQNQITTIIGSHNEYSNQLGVDLMKKHGIPLDTSTVHFSQLYGMSDNITFNLAKAGCNASKYLPFGPVNEVIPYLMRRAEENSAMSGQSSRELELINQELKRRGV